MSSTRPAALSAAVSAAVSQVPAFGTDLDLAIGALTQAVRLTDPADWRQPAYTAALCTAHGMRYMASFGNDDLLEVGRLCRAVLGHPQANPGFRRHCGEWLLAVLARRAASSDAAASAGPRAGWPKPSPSADGDLDTMFGVLAAFAAEDGAALEPALSSLLTDFVLTRSEGNLSDAELAAEYARARKAAADLANVPAAQAGLLLRAAEIGAQLVYRGIAPAGVADEVAAAYGTARRQLPAGHPVAREAAARGAAFKSARLRPPGPLQPNAVPRTARPSAVQPSPVSADQAEPAPADDSASPVTGEVLPPVLDVFGIRALAALGVGAQGWLTGTAGKTAEAAAALLAQRPRDAAGRAAVLCVLALAQYETWLRERAGDGLGGSLDHARAAVSDLPEGHPLRTRLTLLLARMLLDRGQIGGDLADADAALTLLDGLRARAGDQPAPAALGELLSRAGPPQLGRLLTASPAAPAALAGAAGYRVDLEAAIGSGRLLRGILAGGAPRSLVTQPPDGSGGRASEDLGQAIAILRQVTRSLPIDDPRRPDVLSDLGLALLAVGQETADPRHAGTEPGGDPVAVEVLREAAVKVAASPGHPRQAAILLRAAAALAAAGRAAAGAAATEDDAGQEDGDPQLVDEGIALLTQALSVAGLTTSGDRSRCLYGLGSALLIRFSRTGRADDLSLAIARLEEARAIVEAVPGDPFLVPLLRALAWAHRQHGYRLAQEHGQPGGLGPARADAPRLPLHQSRSVGRSVLYAHAQSVLLQSGSRHALAAARAIGEDALTLAEWCIADGRVDSAVEALELGRALVLHAATVAADVPALLREAGHQELAAEWDAEASAAPGPAGAIDAIPGTCAAGCSRCCVPVPPTGACWQPPQ